jgi:hypothetical protein
MTSKTGDTTRNTSRYMPRIEMPQIEQTKMRRLMPQTLLGSWQPVPEVPILFQRISSARYYSRRLRHQKV